MAIFVVVGAFFAVGYQVYAAQPNRLILNGNNLTAPQYQALQSTTAAYSDDSDIHFFTTSLTDIQRHIATLDWVNQIDIQRKWRKGIVVTVFPRRAVARFGSEQLIDAQGKVFKPVDAADLSQQGLIMLQSEAEQSFLVMQQLQHINQWFMPLDMAVSDMVLTPRMTWVIKFDDGLRVVVDNENTTQKLMNLSQLLQNQLADKRADIAAVDLRYKNGFVIDWVATEGALNTQPDNIQLETTLPAKTQ